LITARQRVDIAAAYLHRRQGFLAFFATIKRETLDSAKNDSAAITR
jgi:hypothetical protein